MADSSKAVFLSYASQDAGAVSRIAEALRATGVEVWFDKNELVGGDAWDQKIRRQIKECALFVPVISANTNARAEGYFRLEWKLAVDRSHLMADDAPFLFPVVIDDTSDSAARVPDKFRDVQWTRLSVKDTPESMATRVARLLEGAGVAGVGDPGPASARPATKRSGPPWVKNVGMIGGMLIGLIYAIRGAIDSPRERKPKPAVVAPAPAPAAAPLSAARQSIARARAMSLDKYDSTAEDFAAAEVMIKRALELDPNEAEAWTLSSLLNTSFASRGFDHAPARDATARSHAERALSLAPDSIEALFALGRWQRNHEDPTIAEATFKKILARDPNYGPALGNLAWVYETMDRPDEAAALYERSLAVPGNNQALTRYTEYLMYFHRSRFEEAERCVRQSIAVQPSANSQSGLAMVLLTAKGDADGAARVLASGVTAARSEPRTIWSTAWVQLCQRAPEEVLKTMDRFSPDFIQDNWFIGPKAYFAGRAHALAGRKEAARLAWEVGLRVVDAHLKETPQSRGLHVMRGVLLALLGQNDEALREAGTAQELTRKEDYYWFSSNVQIYALLGRADEALPLLSKQVGAARAQKDVGWPLTPALLRLDPLWDKLRDDPRFQALCVEPAAEEKKVTATPLAPLSEGAQLAAKALALITKVGFTRDDLAPAEDFARRATEKEPDSAAAWGVRAGVQSAWLFRGWDYSEKRRQDTQSFANRALALDPNEPEALLALGTVLRNQGAFDQAVALLRRASAAHPDHIRLVRSLGYTLNQQGHDAEARTILLDAKQQAPRDPLLRYELALAYSTYGSGGSNPENLAGALGQLDAAIAIQPFSSALILKAALIGGWQGDLVAMRAVLDQQDKLPLSERSEDRSVCVAMWAGLLEHRPDRVEAAAALTARNYFEDAVMPYRPKSWSLALAHQLAGKDAVARSDWMAAETVLRQRLKDEPAALILQAELATTLAQLGQREEATRLIGLVEPIWREAPVYYAARALAQFYAAMGDARNALPYLSSDLDHSVFSTHNVIPLDPWWDKIRTTPEFEAALRAAAAKN